MPASGVNDTQACILVVEDDPKNRKLVRRLLEINKFVVLDAEDAETAIQIANASQPDLILMDIHLPGMDGLQATRIIKDTPTLCNIHIIALTSYAMEGDAEKAQSAGCDGYIAKPINTRTFISAIKPHLPRFKQVTEKNASGHLKNRSDDALTQPVDIFALRGHISALSKKKALLDRLHHSRHANINPVIFDRLTGLHNFDYCVHVLKHELQRSLREQTSVALVTMVVNNALAAGCFDPPAVADPFFIELGALIQSCVRKRDLAARRSTQAFAFVLPDSDVTMAQDLIRRLKKGIRQRFAHFFPPPLNLDHLFVFGIAVCPDDANQLEDLVQRVDEQVKRAMAGAEQAVTPCVKGRL